MPAVTEIQWKGFDCAASLRNSRSASFPAGLDVVNVDDRPVGEHLLKVVHALQNERQVEQGQQSDFPACLESFDGGLGHSGFGGQGFS